MDRSGVDLRLHRRLTQADPLPITWPFTRREVKGESLVAVSSATCLQMKRRLRLRMSAEGSTLDSTRMWKPLPMPKTSPPSTAKVLTAVMTGEKRVVAPQRR